MIEMTSIQAEVVENWIKSQFMSKCTPRLQYAIVKSQGKKIRITTLRFADHPMRFLSQDGRSALSKIPVQHNSAAHRSEKRWATRSLWLEIKFLHHFVPSPLSVVLLWGRNSSGTSTNHSGNWLFG